MGLKYHGHGHDKRLSTASARSAALGGVTPGERMRALRARTNDAGSSLTGPGAGM
jgi:hypothetical protein